MCLHFVLWRGAFFSFCVLLLAVFLRAGQLSVVGRVLHVILPHLHIDADDLMGVKMVELPARFLFSMSYRQSLHMPVLRHFLKEMMLPGMTSFSCCHRHYCKRFAKPSLLYFQNRTFPTTVTVDDVVLEVVLVVPGRWLLPGSACRHRNHATWRVICLLLLLYR